jgi:hypothetical protein
MDLTSIKSTLTGAVGKANGALQGAATSGAGKLGTFAASKTGFLAKAAGFLGKGLAMFAKFTPIGKAATIAVGLIGAKALLSSHPANGRA